MAKTRTASVAFQAAYRAKSYGTAFTGTLIPDLMCGEKEQHAVTFNSLDDLTSQVRALADDYATRKGHGSVAWIHLSRGERKPPGFDKAIDTVRYLNLTLEPEATTAA